MRRFGAAITCLAGVAAALALAGGPAGAQDETPLETMTVPATAGSNVLSNTTLESGKRYKLVATETWNESNGNDTYYHDAIYCFDEFPKRNDLCSAKPEPFGGKLYVGYENSGTITAFPSYLGATNPPYTITHRYEVPFTADRTARLKAFIVPQQNFSEGQVVLELYKLPDPTTTETTPTGSGCGTSKIAKAAACEIKYDGNTITMKLTDPGKGAVVSFKKKIDYKLGKEIITVDLTPDEMRALELFMDFIAARSQGEGVFCMTMAAAKAKLDKYARSYGKEEHPVGNADVRACIDTIEVFFEAGKGTTRATAAASGCYSRSVRLGRSRIRRRPPVTVRCKRRGPFTQIEVTVRKGFSVRRTLGSHVRIGMYRPPTAPRSSRRISLSFAQRRR